MKTIHVHDPPMCNATGICGTDIDRDLVNFAAHLAQPGRQGITVEPYNLSQQPEETTGPSTLARLASSNLQREFI